MTVYPGRKKFKNLRLVDTGDRIGSLLRKRIAIISLMETELQGSEHFLFLPILLLAIKCELVAQIKSQLVDRNQKCLQKNKLNR